MTQDTATATALRLSAAQRDTFYVVRGTDGTYGVLSAFQHDGIAANNSAWFAQLAVVDAARDGSIISA